MSGVQRVCFQEEYRVPPNYYLAKSCGVLLEPVSKKQQIELDEL